ncbi:MAG TPA: CopG family transcriptional regulator [Chloroflexota bacterium]|nr:CopG family transcriptional regulator [Chloroflexota bacterium]
MAVKKLSVSVPAELAREVRREAGQNGVSAFVTKSLRRQLDEERRRRAMREYLDGMDEKYGPLTEEEIEEGRSWFRD